VQQPIRWSTRRTGLSAARVAFAPDVWPFGNVEAALFDAGLKPTLKLEDLTPGERRRWWYRHDAPTIACGAVQDQRKLPSTGSRLLAGKGSQFRHPITYYMSHSHEALHELLRCEREQRTGGPGRAEAIRTAGRLLGYPDCCTAAFATLERQDDAQVVAAYGRNVTAEGKVRVLRAADPLLNFFPPLSSPVSWYPCSLSCSASVMLARRALSLLPDQEADRLRGFLSGAVLAFDKFRFVHLHGAALDGDRITWESVSDALSTPFPPRALAGSSILRAFRREVTRVFASARELTLTEEAISVRTARGRIVRGLLLAPLTVVWFPSTRASGGAE